VTDGRSAPPFLPPAAVNLPYGIGFHPDKPYVYYDAAIANRLVVFRYDSSGQLSFVSQAENPDVIAACWIQVTKDGKYLYTGNGGSRDISAFRLSKAGDKAERIQLEHTTSDGNIGNIMLDPSSKYLYAIAVHNDPDIPRDPPAPGNFIDTYKIRRNGKLSRVSSTPLPVPIEASPYGLAVLEK